ncbi:MAG: hypothetical protein ACYC8T_16415, partial [Myxococcaceae bacterium]
MKTVRVGLLGLFVGLVAAVALSCGQPPKKCGPPECAGCCDSAGTCQPGVMPAACGMAGTACV